MSSRQKAEVALHDQTDILPLRKLLVVFGTLAASLFICYADQNGIAVALPTMARSLHAEDTISWAGTSALIANTVFQVLYGRMSDIFGRKVVLLSALAMLAIGDILCATAQNSTSLYVFRGLSGIANGGINSLTMMIVSDVVTLEERGKYQGILGSCIGLGNTVGPFLSAAFAQRTTWRGFFYFVSPFAALCGVLTFFLLPSSMPKGRAVEKVKLIDVSGLLTGSVAIIFLLIPLSGGGSYFPWDSAMVISMLAISGVAAIAFIFCEWKVAKLPMMPLSMFTNIPVCTILIQNFLFGIVYYSELYYLPIYYENVRGWSLFASAGLTIPIVVAQSLTSIVSGQYISRMKRYGEVLWSGFGLWTLGAGLTCIFNRHTHPAVIAVILSIIGVGVGNVFQPVLIALQAHCTKSQRAVVISNRNFLRSLGGAFGLAMSSLVLQSTLKKNLPPKFAYLVHSAYSKPDYSTLSSADRDAIEDAYMKASRMVFIYISPIIGACFLACIFIKDRGLERPPEPGSAEKTPRVGGSTSTTEPVRQVGEDAERAPKALGP